MTVDLRAIHRWIWDEIVSFPAAETALEAASVLVANGSIDTAASLLDRAWGHHPSHRALQDARANVLDSLAVKEHSITFRYVPAGWFWQGSEDGDHDERPRRRVELDPFWIADAPLTWTQIATFADLVPAPSLRWKSEGRTDDDDDDDFNEQNPPLIDSITRRMVSIYSVARIPVAGLPDDLPDWQRQALESATPESYNVLPAVGISWANAVKLAAVRSTSAIEYTLPTEAQWERAARGGLPDARYPWGDTDPSPRFADYDRFEEFKMRPTRELVPNGYGLVAMAGTLNEWCLDWYDAQEYLQNPARNPVGPPSGKQRVARGGSWADCPATLRVSYRSAFEPSPYGTIPTIGMRLVRRIRPV